MRWSLFQAVLGNFRQFSGHWGICLGFKGLFMQFRQFRVTLSDSSGTERWSDRRNRFQEPKPENLAFLFTLHWSTGKPLPRENRRNQKPEPLEPFHARTIAEPNRTVAITAYYCTRFGGTFGGLGSILLGGQRSVDSEGAVGRRQPDLDNMMAEHSSLDFSLYYSIILKPRHRHTILAEMITTWNKYFCNFLMIFF